MQYIGFYHGPKPEIDEVKDKIHQYHRNLLLNNKRLLSHHPNKSYCHKVRFPSTTMMFGSLHYDPQAWIKEGQYHILNECRVAV